MSSRRQFTSGSTGRGIDMPPVVRDVEPVKPTQRRDDLDLSGSVGEGERNRPAEVIKLKKALVNTGLFDFDVTREKSTDAGPMFRDATKSFQRLNGIEPDDCIKPDCPTRKALNARHIPRRPHQINRIWLRLAGAGGFEPPMLGPKPSVLPLHHAPIKCLAAGRRRDHNAASAPAQPSEGGEA